MNYAISYMRLYLIVAAILLSTCNSTNTEVVNREVDSVIVVDTAKTLLVDAEKPVVTKISEYNEQLEAIRLNKVLTRALMVAKQNIAKTRFNERFTQFPDDSSYEVTAEIVFGNLFSADKKHLLIRRVIPWATYLNLYYLQNDSLVQVIYREQGGMTYVKDTILDANGDGQLDYLVHWYPSSGCCRRNIFNVYLYQQEKGTFSSDYEFVNPTFFSKEKIVRGVMYGHPGEAGLYKYRWSGSLVDTVEFIYHDVSRKGYYIKTKKPAYRPTAKDGTQLNKLPLEYQAINDIDWFNLEE